MSVIGNAFFAFLSSNILFCRWDDDVVFKNQARGESNRRIAGVNKQRRYPNQDSKNGESSSHEGQIIKYEPLINKAAKEMMMHILKYGTTPRLESVSNSGNTLVDNIHSSPETFDSGTLRRNEVPSTSSVSCSPAPTEHSMIFTPPAPSEIQSSEPMVTYTS